MIKPIVKDEFFLSIKSEVCTKKDIPIAKDLMDTLSFHKKRRGCVLIAPQDIFSLTEIIFMPIILQIWREK